MPSLLPVDRVGQSGKRCSEVPKKWRISWQFVRDGLASSIAKCGDEPSFPVDQHACWLDPLGFIPECTEIESRGNLCHPACKHPLRHAPTSIQLQRPFTLPEGGVLVNRLKPPVRRRIATERGKERVGSRAACSGVVSPSPRLHRRARLGSSRAGRHYKNRAAHLRELTVMDDKRRAAMQKLAS